MPIKSCTLPNGGKGFKYGDKGKCYKNKKDAIKQGLAIHDGDWVSFHKEMANAGYTEDELKNFFTTAELIRLNVRKHTD